MLTCGYSLESSRRGDSNEYSQHIFLWRNKQNYPLVLIKYPSYMYLFFWKSYINGCILFLHSSYTHLVNPEYCSNFNAIILPPATIEGHSRVSERWEYRQKPSHCFVTVYSRSPWMVSLILMFCHIQNWSFVPVLCIKNVHSSTLLEAFHTFLPSIAISLVNYWWAQSEISWAYFEKIRHSHSFNILLHFLSNLHSVSICF